MHLKETVPTLLLGQKSRMLGNSVDVIRQVWDHEEPNFPNYQPGSMGPKEADELLARDGRQWVY